MRRSPEIIAIRWMMDGDRSGSASRALYYYYYYHILSYHIIIIYTQVRLYIRVCRPSGQDGGTRDVNIIG
jgi:hypothetical protein